MVEIIGGKGSDNNVNLGTTAWPAADWSDNRNERRLARGKRERN